MSARTGIHLPPPPLAASIRRAALIATALATTGCSSRTPPPNLTPLLWVIVPAIFIALAIYETVLRRQRTRMLETGKDVIASWTCPDEVWIAHTRNKLRTTLRFAGIFALLIFGLAAVLHVTRHIVFSALGAAAVAVFVAVCVAPFLLTRWWPTRFRNVRVVIGRDGGLVAGRNYMWRRANQHFIGAQIEAGSPRLLVIEVENPGVSPQTHGSLEIPLAPADEATAQRVVRSLGDLPDDGLIQEEPTAQRVERSHGKLHDDGLTRDEFEDYLDSLEPAAPAPRPPRHLAMPTHLPAPEGIAPGTVLALLMFTAPVLFVASVVSRRAFVVTAAAIGLPLLVLWWHLRRTRTRRRESFARSRLLASWTVADETWRRGALLQAGRSLLRNTFRLVGMFGILLAVYFWVPNTSVSGLAPGPWLLLLFVTLPFALAGPLSALSRATRSAPPALVALDGVLVGSRYHTWGDREPFESASVQSAVEPTVLRVEWRSTVIDAPGFAGGRCQVDIVVPSGKEGEAEQVAKLLNHHWAR